MQCPSCETVEREQELCGKLLSSLSDYKLAYLSCFEGVQGVPGKAQREIDQIQEMLRVDLKELSYRYSCSLKEIKTMISLVAAPAKDHLHSRTTPSGSQPILSKTGCFSLVSVLGKPEVRKHTFQYQEGKPMHEFSPEAAAAANHCELLMAQTQKGSAEEMSKAHPCKQKGKGKGNSKLNCDNDNKSDLVWEYRLSGPCGHIKQEKADTQTIALIRAAENNALQAAEFLLDAGANPNAMLNSFDSTGSEHSSRPKPFRNALSVAYDSNYPEMLDLLISKGGKSNTLQMWRDSGKSLLHKAWETGGRMTCRKFRLLMQAIGDTGSDVGPSAIVQDVTGSLLRCAVKAMDVHTSIILMSKLSACHHQSELKECLNISIRSGQYDLIRAAVNQGAIVDLDAISSAVTHATSTEHQRILDFLLTAVERQDCHAWQYWYRTSITNEHYVERHGLEVLKALLRGKHFFPELLRQREERESGLTDWFEGTPLMIAAAFGNHEALKLLLNSELYRNKEHVDERAEFIDTADFDWAPWGHPLKSLKNGDTALFLAAASGESKAIALLLKAGADPSLFNNAGDQPIHRAIDFFRWDLGMQMVFPHPQKTRTVAIGKRFAAALRALLERRLGLVDGRDSKGRTALMNVFWRAPSDATDHQMACYAAALVPVEMTLLEMGANMSLSDADGTKIEDFIESEVLKKTHLKTVTKFRDDQEKIKRAQIKAQTKAEKKAKKAAKLWKRSPERKRKPALVTSATKNRQLEGARGMPYGAAKEEPTNLRRSKRLRKACLPYGALA